MMGNTKGAIVQIACVIGVLVGFVCVWQAVVATCDIPRILLPSPWRVAQVAWADRVTLVVGIFITGAAALAGLLGSGILGVVLATAFSQSRILRTAFYPYVIFLQTVPIVAIAPLLITWFGYGFTTVVLVAGIISLFPIVSNVTSGLMTVDENLRELFLLHSATRWQTLLKLRIPGALHSFVQGMRISTGLAVIGAVIGEFFVGSGGAGAKGLGSVMVLWRNRGRTDALIAAIIASTLLGLLLLALTNVSSRLLLSRWTRRES